MTSTGWELPTDRVHPVARGHGKVQHWLGVHTEPLAEHSTGLPLHRLIGTGTINSSMNKGLQPGSRHELFVLNENTKEENLFGHVFFTDLTTVRQPVFEKSKSRKSVL